MSRWGPYVHQRIEDLKYGKGREDWIGEWPSPIACLSAWDWAVDALPEDAPTPSVVPTDDGCVALVWHKCGWDIEIEVDRESYAALWSNFRAGGRVGPSGDLAELLPEFRALMAELVAVKRTRACYSERARWPRRPGSSPE